MPVIVNLGQHSSSLNVNSKIVYCIVLYIMKLTEATSVIINLGGIFTR
jgi:hypothetical protein